MRSEVLVSPHGVVSHCHRKPVGKVLGKNKAWEKGGTGVPKWITDLAPLSGRMTALFMAQPWKHPTNNSASLSSASTATTTASVGTQVQWKPSESSKDEIGKGSPKNNRDMGKRKARGLPKSSKKNY